MTTPPKQFRYVFTTDPNEASLYHVVQPNLSQVSEETIDPTTMALRVDRITNMADSDASAIQAPKVTLTIDQRTGQVNVLVSPLMDEFMPRTPAIDRMRSIEAMEANEAGIRMNHKIDLRQIPPCIKPPRDSRLYVQSPAGVAIRTPAGTNYLPAGSIKTPSGDIYTPKGVSYSPGGTCYWPKGTQFDDEGGARTPAGTSYTPGGTGFGVLGHVYTPQGTAYSPSGLAYTGWRGTYRWKPEYPPSPRSNFTDESDETVQPPMYPEQLSGKSPATMGYNKAGLAAIPSTARSRASSSQAPSESYTPNRARLDDQGLVDSLPGNQRQLVSRSAVADTGIEEVTTAELEREQRELERRDSLKEERDRLEQQRYAAEAELEEARIRAEQSRRDYEAYHQKLMQTTKATDTIAQKYEDAEKLARAREEAKLIERVNRERSAADERNLQELKEQLAARDEARRVRSIAQDFDVNDPQPVPYQQQEPIKYTPDAAFTAEGRYDPNLERQLIRQQSSVEVSGNVPPPTIPGESTLVYKPNMITDAKRMIASHSAPPLDEPDA